MRNVLLAILIEVVQSVTIGIILHHIFPIGVSLLVGTLLYSAVSYSLFNLYSKLKVYFWIARCTNEKIQNRRVDNDDE